MNYVKIEKQNNNFEVSRLSMDNGNHILETVNTNSYAGDKFLVLSIEKYEDFEYAVKREFNFGNYDPEELDADEIEFYDYTPFPLFDLIKKAGLFEDEQKMPNEMRIKALKFVKDQKVDINVYNADDENLYELKRDFPRINFNEPFFIIDRIGGTILNILQASDVDDFRYLVKIANEK